MKKIALMRTASATALLIAVMTTIPTLAQTTQPAGGVPVRAVTLFSSGVGYFEHFGTVTGDSATELRFKTAQINDILKSLVLQDLDGGKVAAVNYASQEPLERKLKSFGVDVSGAPTTADLLGQLRGAKVTVVTGDRTVSGTILGVEKKQVGTGQVVVERQVLTILSGGTIRSEVLDDVKEVRLEDAKLQEELGKALEAVAGARDQEKKTVVLKFDGAGERRVRVGYVVETPVWKTSYRLLMGEKPAIQGWAIVENQTDSDWSNVQLSLVSGRPISFIQDLYTPLFVPRPTVVPELYASLRPQEYDGGVRESKAKSDVFGENSNLAQRRLRAPMAPSASMAGRASGFAGGAGGGDRQEESLGLMDAAASVQSVASAAKVGELFQYTVGSVSLPRQTSAMIPIVTDPIEIEKVSIYNMNVMPKNPLNGARVKNTTGKHLLAGPVTVIEAGTYGGDARIDNVPPGQERLLSYGIDLQMAVDATKNSSTADIQTASISRGVLTVVRKTVFTQEYVLENKSDAEKTVVVEHPRRGGDWKLVDSPQPMEKTDAVYRFKDKVAPGKSSTLTAKEEVIAGEGIALINFEVDDFVRYAGTGPIPAKVKDALLKAADLKRRAVQTQRDIEARQARVNEMTAEQNRLRENLKTVQQTSEYAQRLLKKLNDQETSLEGLQSEMEKLRVTLQQQQRELADYIAGLEVA